MPNDERKKTIKTPVISLDSLTKRIIDRERAIDERREAVAAAAYDTITAVLEQGKDLLEMRNRVAPGHWHKWLKDHFTKTARTAQRYIAAYIKSETNSFVRDIKFQAELFEISGIAPEPARAPAAALPSVSVPPIFQRLNFVAEWVGKEGTAVKEWAPAQREELRQRLRPVVELYEQL